MKKIIFTTLISTLFLCSAWAQQDAGFSQYFFNQLYINPAYAGSKDALVTTLVHRSQWVGVSGAPITQSLTMHMPIPHTRAGVGLQVYNDKTGPLSNTAIQATYSYYIPVGSFKLAYGLAGSLHNMRVNWDEINIDDKTDQSFLGNSYSWVPDVSAGAYLYKERFYAGISATHFLQSRLNLANNSDINNPARFYRTYYFTTGIVLKVNDKVDFRPSILVKGIKASPINMDFNASFIFNQKFFIGAGFRTGKRINIAGLDNQVIGILEYQFNNSFRIGYSYDWYLNRTGKYNNGTHEVMIGFNINVTKTKMSSPIFF